MLISPAELLAEARRGGWAIGGSNVYNLESARAVVRAAERAPRPRHGCRLRTARSRTRGWPS